MPFCKVNATIQRLYQIWAASLAPSLISITAKVPLHNLPPPLNMTCHCRCVLVSSDDEDKDCENDPPFAIPGLEATKEQLCDVSVLQCITCQCFWLPHISNKTAVLVQALWEAQLNSQKRQEENTDLKHKLDAVTQQIPKCQRKHAQEYTEFDKEIAKLRHMFVVMYKPWVEHGLFQQPHLDKSLKDPGKFKSEKAKEEGIIAELYEAVPEKLHKMLVDQSHFATIVGLQVFLYHFA